MNDDIIPPDQPNLAQCQHDAVVLAGLLEAIDLMAVNDALFANARCCVTMAALQMAKKLADDLDEVPAA